MSITFLAIAASLLTAGNPQPAKPSTSAVPISTSQVQPLAAPTPDSWQAATGKTEPLFKVSLVKNTVTACCKN